MTRTASMMPEQRSCFETISSSQTDLAFCRLGLMQRTKCVSLDSTIASSSASCVWNLATTPWNLAPFLRSRRSCASSGESVKSWRTAGSSEPLRMTIRSSETGSLFFSRMPWHV